MKKILFIGVALTLAACALKEPAVSTAPAVQAVMDQAYTIGCGDVLHISAWKEESLTRQVSVLPDGTLTFPLVGEIKAQGKTVSQLKKTVEERLAVYMPGANVSVQVLQTGSMMIYVIGKVNAPGHYPIHENVTVMQALTMARGLNPFADKDDIRIFRSNQGGTTIFDFNYSDVAEGKNLEQNIRLERGDLVVVQ